MNRAYSLLTLKAVEEDQRIIIGTATTPEPDRLGDVIEPLGISYKNPLPLLHHHQSDRPIGTVVFDKPTKNGITFKAQIPHVSEPASLKDRVDTAWAEVRTGLVRGVSIGFRAIEKNFMDNKGGIRFTAAEVLELSLVCVPANASASITTIRSIDALQRAASGQRGLHRVVHLTPPGASGSSERKSSQEGAEMKTIAEQIVALENKRAASASAAEAVMQKSLDEDRTSDASEQDQFDNLHAEIEAIDKDLVRLRQVEKMKALAAKPVIKADTAHDGAAARGGASIVVRAQPKLPPGIAFAQMVRCMVLSHKVYRPAIDLAREFHGPDSVVVAEFAKAAVPAGSTITGNWAADLVGAETGAVADFVAFLHKQTILGRFGQGGIPALRAVAFRTPLITQTDDGEGYWVGQGKAKPLTSFDFTRRTLEPLKVANICALTNESIRYSNPKADTLIRDSMAAALRKRLDTDFIDPTKTAVANVSPASITNGADTVASSGDTADDIRLDIRALWAKFTAANNTPSSGVWVMSSGNAVALAMMTNPLGQPEFGTMSMSGGTLGGMPVIASDYVTNIVVLLNAGDIYLADDGEIDIQSSREASLEMSDAPAHDSITPTPATLVSMFQTNSTAILAERTINWLRRRDESVAYLTGVAWGGEVPTA